MRKKMSPPQFSSTYVITSVLGTGQAEPLELQAAQRLRGLAQLAIPAATCPCPPCRSIDYAWWPLTGPFPWMVTLRPCERSASSPLDMVPWSLWMNVTPLASWGLQDGGNKGHPRSWVGVVRVGGETRRPAPSPSHGSWVLRQPVVAVAASFAGARMSCWA